ncbi:hypothetical protein ACFFV7_52865 [Nonomuraea spiralis]|uniref:Uncharacterized protein n=1 Tax=Nonomuraea spiralis TaxID=46182 RepID=A0ABV5IZF6_9ACTN|nr:hypothetical protein [Nonomuraea spiralis]GGT19034.1 hypothetical protein GCM10010176_074380 [Nonomuraea spiralis]
MRTILVTGATSGLGLEPANRLTQTSGPGLEPADRLTQAGGGDAPVGQEHRPGGAAGRAWRCNGGSLVAWFLAAIT